jgi:hypothetical protein
MPTHAGADQERYLLKYLRVHRHCVNVIGGDQQVRDFLGAKGLPKCADALGLHQAIDLAGPRRVTVAESKGTDMDSAVVQLGNAAAGVYEKFGIATTITLLVLVPRLVERPHGSLSPGHGYRAEPLKTGRDKFNLQESMGGVPFPARPKVTYPEWAKWSDRVSLLSITVIVRNE